MTTSRRDFVKLLATIPVALSVPQLIGDIAGGFYAEPPSWRDMDQYMRFSPQRYLPQRYLPAGVVTAEAYALWAPLGSSQGLVQMYGGVCALKAGATDMSPDQRNNMRLSMRATWAEDHYPGWLRVLKTDADEPARHEWTRIGYLKWLKPDEMRHMNFTVAA